MGTLKFSGPEELQREDFHLLENMQSSPEVGVSYDA